MTKQNTMCLRTTHPQAKHQLFWFIFIFFEAVVVSLSCIWVKKYKTYKQPNRNPPTCRLVPPSGADLMDSRSSGDVTKDLGGSTYVLEGREVNIGINDGNAQRRHVNFINIPRQCCRQENNASDLLPSPLPDVCRPPFHPPVQHD